MINYKDVSITKTISSGKLKLIVLVLLLMIVLSSARGGGGGKGGGGRLFGGGGKAAQVNNAWEGDNSFDTNFYALLLSCVICALLVNTFDFVPFFI